MPTPLHVRSKPPTHCTMEAMSVLIKSYDWIRNLAVDLALLSNKHSAIEADGVMNRNECKSAITCHGCEGEAKWF